MKRSALVVAVVLSSAIAWAAETVAPTVQLSFTGIVGEAKPLPEAGTTWLALVRSTGGYDLVSTRVTVEPVAGQCTDAYKRVTATGVVEPLFLVRGSPALRPGPVDSVFHGERRFLFPAESMSLKLKTGEWFGFRAYGTAQPGLGGPGVTNYQIVMFWRQQEQVVVNLPVIDMDGPPQLIWAGDLDRDGKLDAIFDVSTSYASDSFVLFLSSQAEAGKLVREVAKFHVPGC